MVALILLHKQQKPPPKYKSMKKYTALLYIVNLLIFETSRTGRMGRTRGDAVLWRADDA